MTKEILGELASSPEPAAQYIARFTTGLGEYLWDELAAAAWLEPSLITRERYAYMDVSLDKGTSYGDTQVWTDKDRPAISIGKVHAQMDVDWPRFRQMFIHLMTSPTPGAKDRKMLRQAPAP